MLIVKFLLNFLKVLNQKGSPRAIAGGFALGMVAGLTPTASPHNLLVLFLVILLPVNISAAILGWGFFSLFAFVFDPLFNRLGFALLTAPALKSLWTALYNTPVVPWTKFNNTLTLGSLVSALLLFFPLFWASIRGVEKYRAVVLDRVGRWKIVQALKATKFFGMIQNDL